MSQSEYKAKMTRQRSRTASKPYDRNNNKLIDKVKSWLAPSSWLSYLSPAKEVKNETQQRSLQVNHSASSSINQTRLQEEQKAGPSKRAKTADLRATLSMLEHVLNDDKPSTMNESTTNSSDSWVAEEDDIPDLPLDNPAPGHQTSALNGDMGTGDSDMLEPEPSVECADRPSRVMSELPEHTVELVDNPAFPHKNISLTRKSTPGPSRVKLSQQRAGSGLSAELSRKLYSNSTLLTSTPQLSPVHEQQEERMVEESSNQSIFQPVVPNLNQSITSATASLSTPTRSFTNESISRSPFRSPFYSGRTSFGGAASQQKMKVKRPRTESSPPVLAPLRVSVHAAPKPCHKNQSLVSQTAKRIMDTLNSLNSPLSDARRIPMRAMPPEMQRAKRRRMSERLVESGVLTPPPTTPMHSTTRTTQIVPNEKSSSNISMTTASPDHTDSPGPDKPPPPTSTPSLLPSIKFPSPVPRGSPENSNSKSKMKSFHSGGKVCRRSAAARARRPSDHQSEEDYTNPVAPPPHVGLTLGHSSSLPPFTFHSQLLTQNMPSSTKPNDPAKLLTLHSSSTPSFSFSTPKTVAADSAKSTDSSSSKVSYGFSVPKPFSSASATPGQPSLVVKPPSESPRPLSKMSVVDALKKPEYSQFKPSRDTQALLAKTTVDLSSSDEPEAVPKPPAKNSNNTPLNLPESITPSAPPGQWTCDTCLVPNKPQDDKCVACTASKPGSQAKNTTSKLSEKASFPTLPTKSDGSWDCDACLVPNKAQDDKCVACTTPKPGSKPTDATPSKASGGFSLGGSGLKFGSASSTVKLGADNSSGFKLGAGLSLGGTAGEPKGTTLGAGSQGLKLGGDTSAGFKLGFGSIGGGLKLGETVKLGGDSNSGFKLGSLQTGSSGITLGKASGSDSSKESFEAGLKLSTTVSTSSVMKSTQSAGITLGTAPLSLSTSTATSQSDAKWTCDACLVPNNSDASACIACTTPKPGAAPQPKPSVLSTGSSGGLLLGSVFGSTSNTLKTGNLQFGVPTTSSSATGISIGTLSAKPTSSPLGGIKLGELKSGPPLVLGNKPAETAPPNPLSGIKLGAVTTSASSQTGLKLGNTPSLFTGSSSLQFGQTASSSSSLVPPVSTNNPLSSITLGAPTTSTSLPSGPLGALTPSTASNISLGTSNPLAGIKLGESSSPTFNFGAKTSSSALPTLNNNPMPLSNSPLAGIKLGGSNTPTTASSLTSITAKAPSLQIPSFPTSAASAAPTFNFSGAQKPSGLFTGSGTSSVFGTPSAGVFSGNLGSLTPAADDSNQAEMASPDNEMNTDAEVETKSGPGLIFGAPQQQQPNIFTTPTNRPDTGYQFNASITKPTVNFGAGSASFNFTGSTPNQASSQPSTGFNFSANSGINLNFGAGTQTDSSSTTFSASPSTGSRLIKKARRRKAI